MAFFSLGHFGLKPFVMEPRDSNCCSSRWTKWLDRFEICLLAADIIDKDRQKALLLLGAGEEVHSLAVHASIGKGSKGLFKRLQFRRLKIGSVDDNLQLEVKH